MKKSEQIEMNFPDKTDTYDVKEMGMLFYPNSIYLYNSFIRDKLNPGTLDTELRKEGEITNIGCPFCKNGFLKLITVKPRYSGGLGRVARTQHHTGNWYEYVCSNPDCSGKFSGEYTWMWID